MRLGGIEVKRRVWIGLGFAVVVVAGWLAWEQGTRLPPPPAGKTALKPFVRFTGAGNGTTDQVLRERADLFDPTPLFFPTEWNYGQRPLPDRLHQQPDQVFGSFEAKRIFDFEDQNMKSYGGQLAPAPEKLADVLAQGNEVPFAGIGQVDSEQTPLPERAGVLEVRDFALRKPIIEQTLKDLGLPRSDFAPLEFVVAINSAGVVGEPVLVNGSGWEDVDAFFRAYLVKTFRLGERLSPGSYRVLVGP